MKKIIAIALAVLMLAALAVPAFAVAPTTYEDALTTDATKYSNDAEVTYGVSQTYTVILPSKIDLGTGNDTTTTADITVSDLVIAGANKLIVTMDSASNKDSQETIWKMTATNGSAAVEYTVEGPENDADGTDHVIPATGSIANKAGEITEDNPATTVLTVMSNVGGQGGSTTLTFATAGTKQADTYKDTITFGVAIVAANS